MSKAPFRIKLLDETHQRASFSSGSKSLDDYFRQQVTQDIRRRVATCFVALNDEQKIADYYTLASASTAASFYRHHGFIALPVAQMSKPPAHPPVISY